MAILKNKKARFDYELLEEYEAGISLFGYEVKSLREGRGKIEGSHVTVRGGEVYLLNAHIPAYQPKNTPEDYDPERPRKLLLKKKEISSLAVSESKRGLTIVPLEAYNKRGKIKVRIAVARGKKKYDKRESLKKRDAQRKIKREMKKKL